MKEKYLFTIKTLINTVIRLFPIELIPNLKAKTKEGQMFNRAMYKCIEWANVNVQTADLRNFMSFMEIVRKAGLYLMEKDGYYRQYVTLCFDEIKQQWKERE